MEEVIREKIMDKVEFTDYVLKYEGQINGVAELLRQPFADNIAELEKQIGTLSSKMEFLSWCFAYAEELLTNASHRNLVPKRQDLTDVDRRMALEYSTSKERLFRDWLGGLNRNIDKYLSNAQSVLATKRQELEKLGYGGRE